MPDRDEDVATVGPGDAELRNALEGALSGRVIEMTRRPSAYRTSFPLEELDLILEGGSELQLVFKDLAWHRLEPEARIAKPEFLHDPLREPSVYMSLLAPVDIGPRCHGALIKAGAERTWLFVERIAGRELYQVGEPQIWQAVARWLAETHACLAGSSEDQVRCARLVDYEAVYYRRWLDRARSFAGPGSDAAALRWLAERYDLVIEGLLELPRTVIHGEFYASNVLVVGGPEELEVVPVDWEMAGWGPGLVDLAALTSGRWEAREREAIVSAYAAGAREGAVSAQALAFARLHLAVQWLGWAPPSWTPPEGQRHDWLAEALALAEGLGL